MLCPNCGGDLYDVSSMYEERLLSICLAGFGCPEVDMGPNPLERRLKAQDEMRKLIKAHVCDENCINF